MNLLIIFSRNRLLTFSRNVLLTLAGCLAGSLLAHADGQSAADIDAALANQTITIAKPAPTVPVAALAALGSKLFFDPALSASGRQSCSSCHSPAHAFGPPNALAAQTGGLDMHHPGSRAVPSLMYRQTTPYFAEHFFEDEGLKDNDEGPLGGFTADGRVNTLSEQARIPLFAPHEMANTSDADLAARLQHSAEADDFRQLFGADIFDQPTAVVDQATLALERFQQTPQFYPYTSKYDAVIQGRAKLTPLEHQGLQLFNDKDKGNCALCHINLVNRPGGYPQFTDYGYAALGVPRNRQLAVNRDPAYFDLGLCQAPHAQIADKQPYCGMFKVPSLRNVATRHVFFHNGVFHSLRKVLEFYVDRDIHPQRWYGHDQSGHVQIYDDLPANNQRNINHDPPFDRKPGQKPRLNAQQINALLAFLQTLNDGYMPKK